MRTESAAAFNLRVRLYDGANGIDSALGSSSSLADALRGLVVTSRLYSSNSLNHLWREVRSAYDNGDNSNGLYLQSVALMGYDGANFDRLRTWGVGVLKTGRAEIDSTTVRRVAVGQVVAGAHNLYWVACSPSGANAEFELTDAIAAAGAVVYDHWDTDRHSEHLNFDPPMKFATGIYLETFTNMTSMTFCYV